MIKVLENKFIWLGKSLFFVDYLLKNITKKIKIHTNPECTVLQDIKKDMEIFVMKDEKLNYDLIDFTPKIFAVTENIDYININKEDSDFINDVFNNPFHNQKYFRMCDDLSNIIFGKKSYSKDLKVSLDSFVNQISHYYERIDNLEKIFLNPSKLQFLEIWKFKLINALKTHYKKQLKKEFVDYDSIFENKLSENKISEDDIESFKISKKNRKRIMSLNDELDDDKIKELDDISQKEAIYLDLQKEKDMSKNKLSIKLKNEIRKKKLLIKNNGFFDYLINKYMNDTPLPATLENKYNQNKKEFITNLENLYLKLKVPSTNDTNKDSTSKFIDQITSNFENIKITNSKYDVKTAISEVKLMNYLENANYLELMSEYAKLTDNLRIMHQYEDENDLTYTPKPEILNLIEKLYLSSLGINRESHSESYEPFIQTRKRKKKPIARTNNSFDEDENDEEDNDESMFSYLNSMFDIFGSNNKYESESEDKSEDKSKENVVVKVDEGIIVDDVFDNSGNSSVLVNPKNIS